MGKWGNFGQIQPTSIEYRKYWIRFAIKDTINSSTFYEWIRWNSGAENLIRYRWISNIRVIELVGIYEFERKLISTTYRQTSPNVSFISGISEEEKGRRYRNSKFFYPIKKKKNKNHSKWNLIPKVWSPKQTLPSNSPTTILFALNFASRSA